MFNFVSWQSQLKLETNNAAQEATLCQMVLFLSYSEQGKTKQTVKRVKPLFYSLPCSSS